MSHPADHFNRWLVASTGLHGLLALALIAVPALSGSPGVAWGSESGGDGGIRVRLEGSAGIALPAPVQASPAAPANPSPGLYQSRPAPETSSERAVQIPDPDARTRRRSDVARSTGKAAEAPAPENAVPFGEGGRPDLNYGSFNLGSGTAGIGVGDESFGQRYGWYVQAITRKVSQNWLRSMVDANLTRAPRVYVGFDIQRDGSITAIEIKQSSSIPALDRSAQRAVYASSPMPPLPTDYAGSRVSVSFWFEYSK